MHSWGLLALSQQGRTEDHGELLKLGFTVSERTVARYLRRIRRRRDPGKRWLAFLQNHREVIVAFDFFTVPTVTFQLLYCFFVIEHGRRKIPHYNVTRHPTAEWVNIGYCASTSSELLRDILDRIRLSTGSRLLGR